MRTHVVTKKGVVVFLSVLAALIAGTRATADCPPEWLYGLDQGYPGVSGTGYAAVMWDPDGPGPLPPDNNGPNVRITFRSFKAADKERMVLFHPSSVVATRNY